ncbi:hypothetical protein MY4824_003407 [Beauveria thailandica]
MGGGDLNLKKSFHPTLRRNQAAVYDEEQKALAERKRTQQRIDEIKEERAKEELQRQLEAAGGKKRVDRVDWMYQGPTDGQAGTTEEMEAYLLGKRRIDNLIKGNDHEKLEKNSGQESFMALQNANSARDTAAKIRDDPLLAIKRQEQAAYEAMMNDPVRRKQLLASMGKTDDSDKKNDGTATTVATETDIAVTIAYTNPDVVHSRDLEAHTGVVLILVMMAEAPEVGEMTLKNRALDAIETIPETDGISRETIRADTTDRLEESVIWTLENHGVDLSKARDLATTTHMTGEEIGLDTARLAIEDGMIMGADNNNDDDERDREEEKARKLAAMQSAASNLDQDRSERLAAIEEKERLARDADDSARERNGDRAFTNGLHRQAGDMDLGARMGRNKHGFQRDDD